MGFADIIKIKLFGYRATSKSYVEHLKSIGVKVGDDVIIYRPMNTHIDTQNPHMLEIGSHVMITGPVTVLTHDYSWSVLKRKYGDILGNQKNTVIKDNVFIGWGATILAGSYIGPNSIIGAGSIVSGKLEGNAVYAGNPACKILTIDEYYSKRKEKQLEEAVDYVIKYNERFGKNPPIEKMNEYFFLFFNPEDEKQKSIFESQLKLVGNYEQTMEKAVENKAMFASYEDFIKYCEDKMQENI